MTDPHFETLLKQARAALLSHPQTQDFCAFPDDVTPQAVVPFHAPCADYLARETGLFSDRYAGLRDAFVAAGPVATWRETYKGTGIGKHFMDRFGCYCLIGKDGAYISAQMFAWVVYMPAHLHYPWHHHPAEEMYLVIAGEAEFMREGASPEVLRAGDTCFHASNQPHAMETHDHPVMALVMWRNGFDTPPVLSEAAQAG
ncbi:hypothetical protein C1J05_08180 [Sulfitobacter sp. JL08]|uniref:dimethylsulfonioproprionate lyase family protein n=1 Tax=Sulfitobacter sp. JL08 TaxID=2070369 RepID=UPI000E0BE972|nr:dimethylsulfonioproprionate lyase family protein [Sulfitobacter sp. JL08]AXI54474.1 hypothetical protein C1J05_08180 [Sulfitobacter sp. JL08]